MSSRVRPGGMALRVPLLVAAFALFALPERTVLADADPLKLLLDRATCNDWREVSRLGRERLRASLSKGTTDDMHLVEQSFTVVSKCAEELEFRSSAGGAAFSSAGLGDAEPAAQRMTRTYAALLAYYKQALPSKEPATALKNWSYLSAEAVRATGDLRAVIERKFGVGAFDRYLGISAKPEAQRNEAEQKDYAAMRPWLEPI